VGVARSVTGNPLFVNSFGSRLLTHLFRYLAQRDAQGFGHSLAVSRIGLQAIADMADLNIPRRSTDRAGSVGKE